MTNQDLVEQILSRLTTEDKGGDQSSTPQSQPLTVNIGGSAVTVNSSEELQAILAKNEEAFKAAYAQQQAQLLAAQQALEAAQKKAKLNMGEPTPDVSFDADQFVQDVVGGKPVDAVTRAIAASPFNEKINKVEALERKIAQYEFGSRHPFYNTPQAFEFLDKVREKVGLGASAEHYEAALALAVQNRLMIPEEVLRAQQQQAFYQMVQAQQAGAQGGQPQNGSQVPQQQQPSYQNYNVPQGMHPSNPPLAAGFGYNVPTLPPPASPRSPGGGFPNSIETAVALADQGKLKGQDLADFIRAATPRT